MRVAEKDGERAEMAHVGAELGGSLADMETPTQAQEPGGFRGRAARGEPLSILYPGLSGWRAELI